MWFSSLTHLTTLTVLRQYFRETPAIRSWRAALMLVTMIMLSVALLPTGDDYWIVFWDPAVPGSMLAGLPVRCFYQRFATKHAFSHDGPYLEFTNERVMVISILILILGYMTRIIKLSSRATDITIYWLRLAPGIQWKESVAKFNGEGSQRSNKFRWRLIYWLLQTVYVCLHAYYEVYESMLWAVGRCLTLLDAVCCLKTTKILWLGLALAWGTTKLLSTSFISVENTWAFGQVVPLVFLALPLLSIGNSYYGKVKSILFSGSSPLTKSLPES